MPISIIDGIGGSGIGDAGIGGSGISAIPASTPPPISCAYPLDALETEIQAAGYTGRLTLSESDQTGAYVVQSGLGSPETYLAAPSNFTLGTSAKLDFSGTGKKAVEWQPQQFDLTNVTAGTTPYACGIVVATVNFATQYIVNINHDNVNAGKYKVTTAGGFGAVTVADNLASLPTGLGIVYDGTAGQIYVRYGGSNFAVTAASLGDMIGALSLTEAAGGGAGLAGNVVRTRFETLSSSFVQSYESGTTDTCGNTI